MILFLERISPDSLVIRVARPKMTTAQMQKALLSAIRKEFEHNMSQQIYVSGETWEAVKTAKESVIKLINTAASKQNYNSPANIYSSIIIKMYASIDDSPTEMAINMLKDEVHEELL